MNRGRDLVPAAAAASPAPTARQDGKQPDIDLNRLVWDPEYREAMRPWLRQPG